MKTAKSTEGTEKWVELGRGGLGVRLAKDWCAGDHLAGAALQDLAVDAGINWTCAMAFNVTRNKLMVRVA